LTGVRTITEEPEESMPYFIKKDSDEYWSRYPSHLADMAKIMEDSQLTPATMHVMGDPTDESAPTALIFTMPPNSVLPRHAHSCERFEVILEGSLTVEDNDLLLGPGDIMIARPGEAYGPHTAGPEGCRTLELFSTLAGAHTMLYETPDGMVPIDFGSLEALNSSRP
jgi:quercetin dioxygenase-like cupin family protein